LHFIAFATCLYLALALLYDLYAYLKPLQKVTLSAKQQELLNWPINYPPELIGIFGRGREGREGEREEERLKRERGEKKRGREGRDSHFCFFIFRTA
jgi:hypothetical protein